MSELEFVIRASGEKGTLDPEDVTRLTRTIRFADKSAGDILVPRVDLTVVESDHTLADVCRLSSETGHSRFPVIGDDTDDVLGVVHVKSALGVAPGQRCSVSVSDCMTEAFVVPEARELDSLLDEMYSDEHHLAFVLDEHGGVAGIVTIEDIVEEIVGEIDDEHDSKNDRRCTRGRPRVSLSSLARSIPTSLKKPRGSLSPRVTTKPLLALLWTSCNVSRRSATSSTGGRGPLK